MFWGWTLVSIRPISPSRLNTFLPTRSALTDPATFDSNSPARVKTDGYSLCSNGGRCRCGPWKENRCVVGNDASMNSVDLFSGLGATALALGDMYGSPICNPAVVCDCCAFSRALLKERTEQGYFGPRSNSIRIADDVRSLTRHPGDGDVQILTAGYCCQDLSTMGTREGLRGSRSGLIFEIPRLADEI